REVTTRSLASAAELRLARATKAEAAKRFRFMAYLYLERMGAVGADRELKLQEELVGGLAGEAVVAAPELGPKLGELARPEGQGAGRAGVAQGVVVGVVGRLVTRAQEPALGELVVAGGVPTDRFLRAVRLLAAAAVDLAAQRRRAIGAGLQRLPAIGQVQSLQPRVGVLRRAVRADAVGEAEVQVGGLGQVHEHAVMAVVREIAAALAREEPLRLAAEDLQGALGEDVTYRQEAGDRDSGADPSFLAAQQVDHGQRLVGPRQNVEVEAVHLAERGPHASDLGQ